MNSRDQATAKELEKRLLKFSRTVRPLLGIKLKRSRDVFVEQMIDAIRRVRYVKVLSDRRISPERMNPYNDLFDPLKAAALYRDEQNFEEAAWLVYLATHFGKNKRTGWSLIRAAYAGSSPRQIWTWARASARAHSFRYWLEVNEAKLRVAGKFGNHRKYESLKSGERGTGAAIESYINWINSKGNHQRLFSLAEAACDYDPRETFAQLYREMRPVHKFGRTAKFDYLTMLGKLGVVDIEPDSPYMVDATGPLSGAKLLVDGDPDSNSSRNELNDVLAQLERVLGLYFGMQIIEDSLCNWQKSPNNYVYFSG